MLPSMQTRRAGQAMSRQSPISRRYSHLLRMMLTMWEWSGYWRMPESTFLTITSGGLVPDVIFASFSARQSGSGLPTTPPDLFEHAVVIEQKILKDAGVSGDADFKSSSMKGRQYTWSEDETLTELLKRRDEIISRHEENINKAKLKRKNSPLVDVLSDALDEDDEKTPCAVCHL